jgi:hypothetical protein
MFSVMYTFQWSSLSDFEKMTMMNNSNFLAVVDNDTKKIEILKNRFGNKGECNASEIKYYVLKSIDFLNLDVD